MTARITQRVANATGDRIRLSGTEVHELCRGQQSELAERLAALIPDFDTHELIVPVEDVRTLLSAEPANHESTAEYEDVSGQPESRVDDCD